jgi:hypothetical protein
MFCEIRPSEFVLKRQKKIGIDICGAVRFFFLSLRDVGNQAQD